MKFKFLNFQSYSQIHKDRKLTFSDRVLCFVRYFILIVFSLIYIGACFFNSNSRFSYNMGLAIVIGAGLFILILLFACKMKSAAEKNLRFKHFFTRHHLLILFLCMFLVFAVQCRIDVALCHQIGWDVSAIIEGAENTNVLYKNEYFSQFPNNLLLVYVLSKILTLRSYFPGINIWFFLAVINTAVVDCAIIMVFFIARRIGGISAGFITFGFMVLLFGFSPWILVPYSDTLSMWVPPAVILLYLHLKNAKHIFQRIIICLLIGIISIIGYYIKPFTVIIILSLLFILFIRSLKGIKRFAAFLLALIFICSGAISFYALDKVQITNRFASQVDKSKEIPFTHFLMMGLNIQVSGATGRKLYGAYNTDDYQITIREKTKQEKQDRNIAVIKKRLKSFGPAGYAEFLAKKANWIFSDGVFWVEGEGNDVDQISAATDPISKLLQSFFRFYGWNFIWFANIEQGVWTLTLFLIAAPLFMKRSDFRNSAVMIARTAIFGLLLYLLLFEARSRYLISFLPLFSILAGYGFSIFLKNFENALSERHSNGGSVNGKTIAPAEQEN